jgi:phosphoenolpyruvate-protein kinase (PTS system EI component)
MGSSLKENWKVVVDLLEKGANEVAIFDQNIVVRKFDLNQPSNLPTTPVTINVSAKAVAQATSVSTAQQLQAIKSGLLQRRSKDAEEIEKRLFELQTELEQIRPSKKKLRSFLRWAVNLDWQTYVKLAKLIIEQVGST